VILSKKPPKSTKTTATHTKSRATEVTRLFYMIFSHFWGVTIWQYAAIQAANVATVLEILKNFEIIEN